MGLLPSSIVEKMSNQQFMADVLRLLLCNVGSVVDAEVLSSILQCNELV